MITILPKLNWSLHSRKKVQNFEEVLFYFHSIFTKKMDKTS